MEVQAKPRPRDSAPAGAGLTADPLPSAGQPQPAGSAILTPETLAAALDPWREVPMPCDRREAESGYQNSLRTLPRNATQTAHEASLGPALATAGCATVLGSLILTGFGAVLLNAVSTLPAVEHLSPPLVHWGASILTMLSFGVMLLTTLWWIPRGIYLTNRDQLLRVHEGVYRRTYLTLCETNIMLLIADQDVWRDAFEHVALHGVMKLVGLGPPKTPEEAVRLAAAFWPGLVGLVHGERRALSLQVMERYGAYLTTGRGLKCRSVGEQFELRARVSAIVDFLLEPPEDMPVFSTATEPATPATLSRARL